MSTKNTNTTIKPPLSPFFRPHTPRRPRLAVAGAKGSGGGAPLSIASRQDSSQSGTSGKDEGGGGVKEAKSSLTGCTANLVNAIVGSGIVGIAFAVQKAGFVLGIFLIALCAVLTDKSLRLLVGTAKHCHTASYETVMEAAFGVAGFRFIAASMFVMAYGAMLSYLMIVKESYAALLGWTSVYQKRAVLWALSLTILVPLACQRDMANLAWTSRLSVVLDTILVGVVAYLASHQDDYDDLVEDKDYHDDHEDFSWHDLLSHSENWFHPETVFVGLGVLSFAFVCQHSAFLIAGSLERPTQHRWSIVTHIALTICFVLACTSGVAGYLGYGEEVKGNVLANLPVVNCWPANLARAMLGTTMLTVYPLESFVARHVCVALLFQGRRAHEGNADSDLLDRRDRRITLTVVLFILAVVPATLFENLGNVLALTGAIGGSCLSYIGPGMVYLGIHGERFLELLQESWLLGVIARKRAQQERQQKQAENRRKRLELLGGAEAALATAKETTPLVAQSGGGDDTTAAAAAAAAGTSHENDDTDAAAVSITSSIQESVQTCLWYLLAMPTWCAIAKYGRVSLDKHMHDLALKSPHPLRIGDVEYKKEFHRVVVTRSPLSSPGRSPLMRQFQGGGGGVADSPIHLSMRGASAGGVSSIDQQIGKQLLQQKKKSTAAAARTQEEEPLEPDPQENPTWYDFLVAIFFCIFGVIALVAGLLSLVAE